MADARQFVKDHQLAVVGTLAGVAVAAVTVFRKPAAPVVQVTGASGGTSPADLLSAFSAGSSAAEGGFGPGVALAQSGLAAGVGLGQQGIAAASQAEGDVANLATTLAQSQVQEAGVLSGLFTPVPAPITVGIAPPVGPPPNPVSGLCPVGYMYIPQGSLIADPIGTVPASDGKGRCHPPQAAPPPPTPTPQPTPSPAPSLSTFSARYLGGGLYNPQTQRLVYTTSGPAPGTIFTVAATATGWIIRGGTYSGYELNAVKTTAVRV